MQAARPIAYLALILVFPLSIAAFHLLRPARAVLLVLVGSVLFLPEGVAIDLPSVTLNKASIPILCCFLGLLVADRGAFRRAQLGHPIDYLILVVLLVPLATTLTNTDVIQIGPVVFPGLTWRDFLQSTFAVMFDLIFPFLIGRVLFRSVEDAQDLCRAFVIGALVYVPFILVELRLSPQWHRWIYGFSLADFMQALRGSGYRPMVFMGHGLKLALFLWTAIFAGWLLVRQRALLFRGSPTAATVVLSLLMPMIKSLAALVYAVLIVPLAWFARPRAQLRVAMLLATIVLVYPVLRVNGWFPTADLLDIAAKFGQDRAQSLGFRFDNEDLLLKRALERPVFGWGEWGRNHVFDEWGNDKSVTDGEWIIRLGVSGEVGFLAYFLLMLAPIFAASRLLKKVQPREQTWISGIALITAVRAIDLLPNSDLQHTVFFAGALLGLARGLAENPSRRLSPEIAARLIHELHRLSRLPATRTVNRGRAGN